jgi:UDP-N-acetylglucosamine pyrophosphorylase
MGISGLESIINQSSVTNKFKDSNININNYDNNNKEDIFEDIK